MTAVSYASARAPRKTLLRGTCSASAFLGQVGGDGDVLGKHRQPEAMKAERICYNVEVDVAGNKF